MTTVKKIIECVPNFSEGKNQEILRAIADAIRAVAGCTVLDVDPGESTNRTVFTFIGSPDAVVQGALAGAKKAYGLIDMSKHSGAHPRMGALDVCPFVPVKNATMDDCTQCAKEFGSKLADELNVPVFLYGYSSKQDYRKTMPQIRSGEYEGLKDKLCKPEWKPDFGPATFVPTWGATVTGARKFLIAYNVNMLATKEQCHRIALNVREQGRGPSQPGRLKEVQGIGWWLEEENMAQVSLNLTDYEVTPLHVAYEECRKDAKELNLPVVGSQIVGLIPLAPILEAADYYIREEDLFVLEEEQKVKLAIDRLGLSAMAPFNPKERIVDYIAADPDGVLVSKTVKDFILAVGARTAAPGGGSVAAVVAALGGALAAMVGQLTYGSKKFEALDADVRRLLPTFHETTRRLIPMIDADTTAFNDYMAALKLPKNACTEEKRAEALEKGLITAIEVPLSLARTCNQVWPDLQEMAKIGNSATLSDLQVAARCLETGVWGAYHNVTINLDNQHLRDADYRSRIAAEAEALTRVAADGASQVLREVAARQRK